MRPFWLDQALAADPDTAPPLDQHTTADVCIVGGGFTGLWTAIHLKQQRPQLDVAIVEADVCGAGASGRNGGCMLPWTTKFFTLQRLYGTDEALRLVKASEQAILDIAAFCREHDIDCDLRRDGTLFTATAPAQTGSTDAVIEARRARHPFIRRPTLRGSRAARGF
jgi:glycine/D-amino acid oxidase-like deaminating enzyme